LESVPSDKEARICYEERKAINVGTLNSEPDNLSRAPEESQQKKLSNFRQNYPITTNAVFLNLNKLGLAIAF